MASVRAKGTTVIDNAAREPEIVDLANMLNEMGAKIVGAGTPVVTIEGVEELHPVTHRVVGDRIEAGTFIVAGALMADDRGVDVTGFCPIHLGMVLKKMELMGIDCERVEDGVHVNRAERIKPVDIQTLPFPGFPTDMQPQIAALLSIAQGTSILNESVWENRFRYVEELKRMGAQITVEGKSAIIEGVEYLKGAPVRATDLRAGAAMIIAGLAAHGVTKIEDIEHIQRGYEDIVEKFVGLGADMYLMLDPTNSDTAKIG